MVQKLAHFEQKDHKEEHYLLYFFIDIDFFHTLYYTMFKMIQNNTHNGLVPDGYVSNVSRKY